MTETERLLCAILELFQRELGAPGARWSPAAAPVRLMVDTTGGTGRVDVKTEMPSQLPAARGYLLNTGTANLVVRVVTPTGTSQPFTLVPNLPEPITYDLVAVLYEVTAKTALEVKAQ